MTALLLMAIFLYGNLVLTGVVEEKSSRVVEVLLARMPARNLLAGKVAGIGLLGFAQFALTALAALIATMVVDSVDIPAVSGGVLAWVVVWFVLGYALYAMAYGALGSLASRTEDAQSVAGPVGYVLVAGYWASFLTVSGDPEVGWSRLRLAVPGHRTVRHARPHRAWARPPGGSRSLAVALTLVAIAGLVVFAGRVYTNAILHTGPTLRLRDAWHSDQAPQPSTTAKYPPPPGTTAPFHQHNPHRKISGGDRMNPTHPSGPLGHPHRLGRRSPRGGRLHRRRRRGLDGRPAAPDSGGGTPTPAP